MGLAQLDSLGLRIGLCFEMSSENGICFMHYKIHEEAISLMHCKSFGEVYPNIRNTGAPEKYPMIVICPDDQLAR